MHKSGITNFVFVFIMIFLLSYKLSANSDSLKVDSTGYVLKEKYCKQIIEETHSHNKSRKVFFEPTYNKGTYLYFGFTEDSTGLRTFFLTAYSNGCSERQFGTGLELTLANQVKIGKSDAEVIPINTEFNSIKHTTTVSLTEKEFKLLCEAEAQEVIVHICQGFFTAAQQKSYMEMARCIWARYWE